MSKFLSQLNGLRISAPSSAKNRGNRFRMTTSYRRVLLILALILVVMLYFKWVQPTQVAILKRLAGKPVQMDLLFCFVLRVFHWLSWLKKELKCFY